jgi:DNA replication protein DnaD
MLIAVNYSDSKTLIKGKLYEVKRGQSIMSLDSWAKRWSWDKSKVRRFLNTLQNDNMIELKSDTITTQLTICNYDSYQDEQNESETQTKRRRNGGETQTKRTRYTTKEGEELKKERNNILFDAFWLKYPNKVAKEKCLKKFLSLSDSDIEKIMATIDTFLSTKPFKDYRHPNPETYLNQKRWEDPIAQPTDNNRLSGEGVMESRKGFAP